MSTDKKRIQAYVYEDVIPKFRIVSALKGYKSMSEYAGVLIEQSIEAYETEHGEIKTDVRGGGQNSLTILSRGDTIRPEKMKIIRIVSLQ